MLPVRRVVMLTALAILLCGEAHAATLTFPYVDRPRTTYSFRITGAASGSFLPPVAPGGQTAGAEGGRTLATQVKVKTGASKSDGTFELALTGETTWRPSSPSAGYGPTATALDYRFILDREGRIVSTNARGVAPGRKFSAWHFVWENLATNLPSPSPRRVSPGQSWVERQTSTQKIESLSVESATVTTYRFDKIEDFKGRAAARLTETTEASVTASRNSGETLYKTRFTSSGRLWLEPATGLLRYAEWAIDARPEGERVVRALTLTYSLLNYSTN